MTHGYHLPHRLRIENSIREVRKLRPNPTHRTYNTSTNHRSTDDSPTNERSVCDSSANHRPTCDSSTNQRSRGDSSTNHKDDTLQLHQYKIERSLQPIKGMNGTYNITSTNHNDGISQLNKSIDATATLIRRQDSQSEARTVQIGWNQPIRETIAKPITKWQSTDSMTHDNMKDHMEYGGPNNGV